MKQPAYSRMDSKKVQLKAAGDKKNIVTLQLEVITALTKGFGKPPVEKSSYKLINMPLPALIDHPIHITK